MPERTKTVANRPEGPLLDTTRSGRLFLAGGRLSGLRVAGEQLPDHLAERVTTAALRLSTSTQATLDLAFADTAYGLLGGGRINLGTEVDYHDLSFRVSNIGAGGDDGLTVTARDADWRAMRRTTGSDGDLQRDTSPTEYLARRCASRSLRFVGQPTPKRRQIGRRGRESDAAAAARFAEELGFIVFATAGTVYFGQPTWLAEHGERLVVTPGDRFLRNPWPSVQSSADDPNGVAAVALEVEPEVGDRVRPGMVIELRKVPAFGSTYLVNDVTIPLDAASAVTVNASTAVNPEPETDDNAAGGAGGAGDGAAGSKRLIDLLRYAGFTGQGLRLALGVAIAESGAAPVGFVGGGYSYADATILGDLDLVDAKWGPSVGCFQIRSLKRPQDFSGDDRLRVRTKLLDALYNARTAYRISNGGRDWGAWSTFTAGLHRQYMDELDAVVLHWDGLPGPRIAPVTDTGPLVWPTVTRAINTPYHQPGSWAAGYHTGVDLAAAQGSRIVSSTAGQVNYSGPFGDYGIMVRVRVGGYDIMYCHLDRTVAKVGQVVRPGTLLAYADNTGRSFGSHLHFEVRPAGAGYGEQVDPMRWLPSLTGGASTVRPGGAQ